MCTGKHKKRNINGRRKFADKLKDMLALAWRQIRHSYTQYHSRQNWVDFRYHRDADYKQKRSYRKFEDFVVGSDVF